mmetsp:Transcript_4946/g.9326  ORF Transcript_4946/g.9326 Transcript_4946/m.9326 type:complete len:127 (+) Transcript_4946:56-436(+)
MDRVEDRRLRSEEDRKNLEALEVLEEDRKVQDLEEDRRLAQAGLASLEGLVGLLQRDPKGQEEESAVVVAAAAQGAARAASNWQALGVLSKMTPVWPHCSSKCPWRTHTPAMEGSATISWGHRGRS